MDNLLGPEYDFSATIPGPAKLGVSSRGKLTQISKNAGAVSAYMDIIGSGIPSTFTSKLNKSAAKQVRPLGIRYFLPTIKKCEYIQPNGETTIQQVSEYINNVPTGNSIGKTVKKNLKDVGMGIQGLGPGIIEDVQKLNPLSLFKAATSLSTPECKLVSAPVNQKGKDGELVVENVFHPELKYTKNYEVDWNDTTKKCMNKTYKKNKGVKCKSAFVVSKQQQPNPRPKQPPNTASSIDPSNINNIEPFTNFTNYSTNYTFILPILIILMFIVIRFR
jgi:hypothetical protein